MAKYQRKGRGWFPPNPKQWDCERNGLGLRDELRLSLGECLDPFRAFDLLCCDVRLSTPSELPLSEDHLSHLQGAGKDAWSGMAIPLPNGTTQVVYNDSHAPSRIRATLMEEFFHIRLGHKPSVIRPHAGRNRTYNAKIEQQAFGSGAAALVPYKALKELVKNGISREEIARQYLVSESLVSFRAKVCKLYTRLSKRAPRRQRRPQSQGQ